MFLCLLVCKLLRKCDTMFKHIPTPSHPHYEMPSHIVQCTTLVHCLTAMLHRNIMHHIGALPICYVAPHHHAPHWCIDMLHRTIVAPHHIGAFHIVKSDLIMRNRGCCLNATPQKNVPPCRRSEAQGKPKLGKNQSPKIFFCKFQKLSGTTRTILLIMILIAAI